MHRGQIANLTGARGHSMVTLFGRVGLVARTGKRKHGLSTLSLDLGAYGIRPGGISYEVHGLISGSRLSGNISPEQSIGLLYGLTSEYLIYATKGFGFYFGIEYKRSATPVANTGFYLSYWIPRFGFCF